MPIEDDEMTDQKTQRQSDPNLDWELGSQEESLELGGEGLGELAHDTLVQHPLLHAESDFIPENGKSSRAGPCSCQDRLPEGHRLGTASRWKSLPRIASGLIVGGRCPRSTPGTGKMESSEKRWMRQLSGEERRMEGRGN